MRENADQNNSKYGHCTRKFKDDVHSTGHPRNNILKDILVVFYKGSDYDYHFTSQDAPWIILLGFWLWNGSHNQNLYKRLQEFPWVYCFLDDRYYGYHLWISLYNDNDLGLYNNYHLYWTCNEILVCICDRFFVFFCISFLVSLSKVIFLFSQSSLFLWRALENIARYLCVNCLIIFILQKLVKQKENYLIASEKLLRKIK